MDFTIKILIPYFGKLPEWADLYFETLRRNSEIHFIFYTDCDIESYRSITNITFNEISFETYLDNARKVLGIEFDPADAYKLCDLRPLYPILHFDEIKDADFYGWTDLDILFGDIRKFYTDEILSKFDVFSTHEIRMSGHFSLFRNTKRNRRLYLKIYDWRSKLAQPNFVGMDEHGITNALRMTLFDKLREKFGWHINNWLTQRIKKIKVRKLYMVEQYTTPFISIPWIDGTINSEQPDLWYYKNGTITNSRNKQRAFMYLHFMNFKSSKYRLDSTKAPWEDLDEICKVSVKDMSTGIMISQNGITPINS